MWIITDLDGTCTDFTHRQHLINQIYHLPVDSQSRPYLFDEFNRHAEFDPPKAATMMVLSALQAQGYQIAVMTGRPNAYRRLTLRWLEAHANFRLDEFYMREAGEETASDVTVKMRMFNSFTAKYNIKVPRHHIRLVLEDRDKMCDMWRGLGLTCWQVAKGVY